MVDFLDDVEFDLDGFPTDWAPSVATDLSRFFVIVFDIWSYSVRKLDVCNLE